MILSMTGFGKKEFQYKDKCINIEIRSLNSKNTILQSEPLITKTYRP